MRNIFKIKRQKTSLYTNYVKICNLNIDCKHTRTHTYLRISIYCILISFYRSNKSLYFAFRAIVLEKKIMYMCNFVDFN